MNQQYKYVVFFDLDETLLSLNSGKIIIKDAFSKKLMPFSSLMKAIFLSALHKLNLANNEIIIKAMVKWLKGFTAKEIEDFVEKIVNEKLVPNLRPSIIQEIANHKKNTAAVLILSAAPKFICDPVAKFLNLNDVICSDIEISEGKYTGKLFGKACVEKQKAVRLKEYCRTYNFKLEDSYYYGDNYTDEIVMNTIGHPVCVFPDKKLRKIASQKDWRIIDD